MSETCPQHLWPIDSGEDSAGETSDHLHLDLRSSGDHKLLQSKPLRVSHVMQDIERDQAEQPLPVSSNNLRRSDEESDQYTNPPLISTTPTSCPSTPTASSVILPLSHLSPLGSPPLSPPIPYAKKLTASQSSRNPGRKDKQSLRMAISPLPTAKLQESKSPPTSGPFGTPASDEFMGSASFRKSEKHRKRRSTKFQRLTLRKSEERIEPDPPIPITHLSEQTTEVLAHDVKCFYEDVLSHIFISMGFSANNTQTMLQSIDKKLKKNTSEDKKRSGPLSVHDVSSLRHLEGVVQTTQRFLTQQAKLRKIVLCQAFFRGHLVRLKLPMEKQLLKALHRKNDILKDLMKTERSYVQHLETAIHKYLRPLKILAGASAAIDPSDIATIFSNIERLYDVHTHFLEAAEKLNWPLANGFGEVVQEKMVPYLGLYGEYAQNFQSSITTLQRLISQKKPKVSAILQETSTSSIHERLFLHSLLAMPINRVHKYEYLFELMTSVLICGKRDNELILRAFARMRETAELVRKSLEEGKEIGRLVQLQRQLVLPLGPLNLILLGRYFVRECLFSSAKSKKKVHCFLFNDLIIICKPIPNSDRFKIKYSWELDSAAVQNLPESAGVGKLAFEVSCKGQKMSLIASTSNERALWVNDIRSFVEKLKKKNKVFGSPLAELLKREKRKTGIPFVVEMLVERLRSQSSLETLGILRVSGNQTAMQNLRDIFDSGVMSPNEVDLSGFSQHDVAGVLKMYFYDLPEPLLTYDLYDRFIYILRKADMSSEQKISTIRSIINGGVPKVNLPVIKFMISFFAEVVSHSSVNQITIKNLAILVSPHFLHPRDQTMENRHDIPFLNLLVELLVENRDEIFSDKLPEPAGDGVYTPPRFKHIPSVGSMSLSSVSVTSNLAAQRADDPPALSISPRGSKSPTSQRPSFPDSL